MKIQSQPHISFAIILGFTATIVSWQFLAPYSFIWSLTLGFSVLFLILFFYPQGTTFIEIDKAFITLRDRRKVRQIPVSDVVGYRIDKVFSFNLRLKLKNGDTITHPADYIVSVKELKSEFAAIGINPLKPDC